MARLWRCPSSSSLQRAIHRPNPHAAREMLYLEAQRLFVEDRGVLVGVISQTDIVGAVATQKV